MSWLRMAFVGVWSVFASSAVCARAQTFKTLYQFQGQDIDGAAPMGGVTLVGDTLFGTTSLGGNMLSGTLFSIGTDGTGYQVVHNFAGQTSDGAGPVAGLTLVGTVLYGTTFAGGRYDHGTVFSYDTARGAYTLIYSFVGGKDGAQPRDKLVYIDGALFGTTTFGGRTGSGSAGGCADGEGCGTIFQIDLASGAETTLYRFLGGGADGNYPLGGLTLYHGILYGTAAFGGSTLCYGGSGCGTIFSYDPALQAPGAYKQVYAFQGGISDGAKPMGDLTEGDGVLYGNTEEGGGRGCVPIGCGTVFSFSPGSGSSAPIYQAFGKQAATGFFPDGTPKIYIDQHSSGTLRGFLFGLTMAGGDPSVPDPQPFGTLYQIDLKTHVHTILHAFDGFHDGAKPFGALAVKGRMLFGVAHEGGTYDSGTIFMLQR